MIDFQNSYPCYVNKQYEQENQSPGRIGIDGKGWTYKASSLSDLRARTLSNNSRQTMTREKQCAGKPCWAKLTFLSIGIICWGLQVPSWKLGGLESIVLGQTCIWTNSRSGTCDCNSDRFSFFEGFLKESNRNSKTTSWSFVLSIFKQTASVIYLLEDASSVPWRIRLDSVFATNIDT